MRALFRSVFLAGALCGVAAGPPPESPGGPARVTQFQMGMIVHMTVWAEDVSAGRRACGEAFKRMSALNRIFSDYEPDSELRRLCARAGEGPVAISPELLEVLLFSRQLAERSGGAFDPTAAPIIQLWRKARKEGRLPAPEQIAVARAATGWKDLVLDPAAGTAELRRPGMKLDLGAVAKGYIADQCLRVLREKGYPAAMIEVGGDTVFGEAPPGRPGWPVEAPAPGVPAFAAANQAISLSGDSYQQVVVDGIAYSHVVDPRTGVGLTNRVSTVVVASRGLVADALSTTGSLLSDAEWEEVLRGTDPAARAWRFRAPEEWEREAGTNSEMLKN